MEWKLSVYSLLIRSFCIPSLLQAVLLLLKGRLQRLQPRAGLSLASGLIRWEPVLLFVFFKSQYRIIYFNSEQIPRWGVVLAATGAVPALAFLPRTLAFGLGFGIVLGLAAVLHCFFLDIRFSKDCLSLGVNFWCVLHSRWIHQSVNVYHFQRMFLHDFCHCWPGERRLFGCGVR